MTGRSQAGRSGRSSGRGYQSSRNSSGRGRGNSSSTGSSEQSSSSRSSNSNNVSKFYVGSNGTDSYNKTIKQMLDITREKSQEQTFILTNRKERPHPPPTMIQPTTTLATIAAETDADDKRALQEERANQIESN